MCSVICTRARYLLMAIDGQINAARAATAGEEKGIWYMANCGATFALATTVGIENGAGKGPVYP
jgi:hypothetical protein